MNSWLAQAQPGVQGLHPYQPGKPLSELEREYGIQGAIKLASNESPLGPAPGVCACLQALISHREGISRYPDGGGFSLKQALANKLCISPHTITLGNGSNDVLELIARVFAGPCNSIVYAQHAFAVYALATQAVGARHLVVPAQGYGHDLPAMLSAIAVDTKIVFIANPNNPTGTWLTGAVLEDFLTQIDPHIIVVVDEAYWEYVTEAEYPNTMMWIERFPNLIVTRTFSKAYGLAGLRIGYAVSHPEVAGLLNRLRQPFNVNSMALAAAQAALADEEHLAKVVALNHEGLAQLTQGLTQLGLEVIPSVGNFVCVDVAQPGAQVYEALLRTGVIVRPVGNYDLPNHLRISVGLPTENARCLNALEQICVR